MWEELGAGAPTLLGFAQLCSAALADDRMARAEELCPEARSILYLARQRGVIEIKGVNDAIESSERLLAVCIEVGADQYFVLKQAGAPEFTLRHLDGFRQLCSMGLVMHHLYREFSLTASGFQLARSIHEDEVSHLAPLAEQQMLDAW